MRILVSACLLGYNCKYNGKNNYNSEIVELLKEHEVVPVCPEMLGGLSCPRIPCEKVGDKIMDKEGNDKPKMIAGVPVGFVGCPESKAELSKYDVPFIRTNGTKGGSTVAVAVMHGILYQMYERDEYFNN